MKKGIKLLLMTIIILVGISLYACKSYNKERVKAGKLSDWQIEVLRHFDYAKEYLRENIQVIRLKLLGRR